MTCYIKWLSIGLGFQIFVPLWDISELLELVTMTVVSTQSVAHGYYNGPLTMWQCSHQLSWAVTENGSLFLWLNLKNTFYHTTDFFPFFVQTWRLTNSDLQDINSEFSGKSQNVYVCMPRHKHLAILASFSMFWVFFCAIPSLYLTILFVSRNSEFI